MLESSQFSSDNITDETEVKVARMASAGEDWRTGKSIIECNRYMLDNSVHTDVIFNVKSTTLLAHRTILISRSQVFESLLMSQASSGVISVPDVEPAVFGKMLSFIYCDSVDVDDSDAAGLLAAAKKIQDIWFRGSMYAEDENWCIHRECMYCPEPCY